MPQDDLQWHNAARPADIAKLPEERALGRLQKKEHNKEGARAKVEYSFYTTAQRLASARSWIYISFPEREIKRRPLPRHSLSPHPAVMPQDDAVHDGQPDPRAREFRRLV